jgi:dihydroneopterin aldolase
MSDVIQLRGLRVMGRHGLSEQERSKEQPFELDIDLELDLEQAARTDDIQATVDYGAALAIAVAELSEPGARLLEHLAERVACRLLENFSRVEAVRVAVRKLRPPVRYDLTTAGVSIRRARSRPVGSELPSGEAT